MKATLPGLVDQWPDRCADWLLAARKAVLVPTSPLMQCGNAVPALNIRIGGSPFAAGESITMCNKQIISLRQKSASDDLLGDGGHARWDHEAGRLGGLLLSLKQGERPIPFYREPL